MQGAVESHVTTDQCAPVSISSDLVFHGLVLHIGLTSCTFLHWSEMPKKNYNELWTVQNPCDNFVMWKKHLVYSRVKLRLYRGHLARHRLHLSAIPLNYYLFCRLHIHVKGHLMRDERLRNLHFLHFTETNVWTAFEKVLFPKKVFGISFLNLTCFDIPSINCFCFFFFVCVKAPRFRYRVREDVILEGENTCLTPYPRIYLF